ncbi:TRAPP complex subunit Trs33 [Schizosaccharomyces cryophilus OY26]|uniref:TRAPP complex subunit Trs33 n=1 Tax=Schizosaccharomyces cryophilus (strain OY26 / ATCC MYA-4695 / CBS 11777 / NBRC 106824 / NRRL Y48691) TaxID=653667 RepID=S9W411_SCHCR|nr:TRAPP complex subunit Trs33 [Schizosaccharomyces cryophilus OY26]EPY52695.1 TRAPP complex subunit Trs33 [Schizosaccharomyces cryophilus OY26]
MIVHQQLPMSVNLASFDFLLIEMVHMARRLSEKQETALSNDEQMERGYTFLENIGFQVGRKLTERLLLTRNRIVESIDVMRFLCRELWPIVFRKQLDNLKTNRKGTFVITDNYFFWFSKMTAATGTEMKEYTTPYLYFPSGFIRGVMHTFGYPVHVIAQCPNLPACIFQVRFPAPSNVSTAESTPSNPPSESTPSVSQQNTGLSRTSGRSLSSTTLGPNNTPSPLNPVNSPHPESS